MIFFWLTLGLCTCAAAHEEDCFGQRIESYDHILDGLSHGEISDIKPVLLCLSEAGNSFATILIAENYETFKISIIDLYSKIRMLAENGDARSLAILGISYIDPSLGVLSSGVSPSLSEWYSGHFEDYEEAGKFLHKYYFGDENNKGVSTL